jgi:hypothetical protein
VRRGDVVPPPRAGTGGVPGRAPLALQEGEVDHVHTGQPGHAGVDVPGQRQVDDDQAGRPAGRPPIQDCIARGDDLGADDEAAGTGAGDQHVGGGDLRGQVGELGGPDPRRRRPAARRARACGC